MILLASCHRNQGDRQLQRRLVVYTSVDDIYARQITKLFTEQTGIQIDLLGDTEETKSTGILNRLIAEKPRPCADIFWSGDPMRAEILGKEGISEPYQPEGLRPPPTEIGNAGSSLTVFSARTRVIIYNRNLLGSQPKPTSIFDLLDQRFASKACIANPLFGTTSMHAAALFECLGQAKAEAFFKGLSTNRVKMLSSNGEVRRRVASGEFAIGLTDSDDVNVGLRDGQPIGFVLPDQDGIGTLLVPNALVLIARGPHPDEARKFIDFVTSERVEKILADSDAAQIPLRHDLSAPPFFGKSLADIRFIDVNYERLGKTQTLLQSGFLKDWVEQQGK